MKNSFWVLFLSALVYSCAQEDIIPVQPQDGGGIIFTSARLNTEVTKGNAGTGITYIPKDTPVRLSAYQILNSVESGYSARSKDYTVSNDEGALTSIDGQQMRLMVKDQSLFKFYGFTPALDFKSEVATKTVSIDNGVDFKIGSVQATIDAKSSEPQVITLQPFVRKNAYTEFQVVCTPGTYIKKVFIGDNGLAIKEMTHGPLEYTFDEANINIASAARDATCVIAKNDFVTPDVGLKYLGGMPVLPRTDNDFPITLATKITTSLKGDGNTVDVNQDMNAKIPHLPLVPGYKYAFSLLFCDPGVVLTLQVSPWVSVSLPADLGTGDGKITEDVWNNITNNNAQGSGTGVLTPKEWADLITNIINEGVRNGSINIDNWNGVLNLIKGGGATGTLTAAQWTAVIKLILEQGLNSGTISVNNWSTIINGILSQGNHNSAFTTSDWIKVIESIITEGIAKGGITPTDWNNAITKILQQGVSSGAITNVDWATVLTAITAQGAHTAGGVTITNWNTAVSYVIDMGYAKGNLTSTEWASLIQKIVQQGASAGTITLSDWASITAALANIGAHGGTGISTTEWGSIISTILSHAAAIGTVTPANWATTITKIIQQGQASGAISVPQWIALTLTIAAEGAHTGGAFSFTNWNTAMSAVFIEGLAKVESLIITG